jgi:hypothetical protein
MAVEMTVNARIEYILTNTAVAIEDTRAVIGDIEYKIEMSVVVRFKCFSN